MWCKAPKPPAAAFIVQNEPVLDPLKRGVRSTLATRPDRCCRGRSAQRLWSVRDVEKRQNSNQECRDSQNDDQKIYSVRRAFH